MRALRKYLAAIGRRGGIRSRRTLDAETARRMVAIREARRVAGRLGLRTADRPATGGTARDTAAPVQVILDALLRRLSPARKLDQVAQLSRMVDRLSIEGLRQRHPQADDDVIRYLRAELRLGPELAALVFRQQRRDGA